MEIIPDLFSGRDSGLFRRKIPAIETAIDARDHDEWRALRMDGAGMELESLRFALGASRAFDRCAVGFAEVDARPPIFALAPHWPWLAVDMPDRSANAAFESLATIGVNRD